MIRRRLAPALLREYDIRGVVGATLAAEDARAIGAAFARMAIARGTVPVAVGRDGRLSSPDLAAALVEGLVAGGAGVVRLGCGPTPLVSFALFAADLPAGIMVTGSHNPPDHNGFKLLLDRVPLAAAEIQELGRIAAAGVAPGPAGSAADSRLHEAYAAHLAAVYRAPRPLRVAWDCGNGATGEIVRMLVARLPGRHILLNDTIDGRFPAHHPDPAVPANLRQLQDAVRREGCDVGFAFDGDGDRLGVVDGTGTILWPDQVLLRLAQDVLRARPGSVIVGDVKSSQVLFDGIAAAGGAARIGPSGYTLVQRRMRDLGAPLAGEMSGHIFFADNNGVDDALYAAVRVLAAAAAPGGLAAFRARLPAVANTPELRIPCPETRKRAVVAAVAARLAAAGAAVDDIDGLRVREAGGWWLLRASNTEPVLAARCEAPDRARLRALVAGLRDHLAACGVPWPAALDATISAGTGEVAQERHERVAGALERS